MAAQPHPVRVNVWCATLLRLDTEHQREHYLNVFKQGEMHTLIYTLR